MARRELRRTIEHVVGLREHGQPAAIAHEVVGEARARCRSEPPAPCAAPSARSCRGRRAARGAGAVPWWRARSRRLRERRPGWQGDVGAGDRLLERGARAPPQAVGPRAGEELVEHDAERIEVGCDRERRIGDLLGRGVLGRQHATRHARERGGAGRAFGHQLGDAEVEQLHFARRGHEDVRRLEVAMQHEARVRVRRPPRAPARTGAAARDGQARRRRHSGRSACRRRIRARGRAGRRQRCPRRTGARCADDRAPRGCRARARSARRPRRATARPAGA